MEYLNKLYSKWMPSSAPRVAVDSHPRLSGIMDTINATLAHGPATRLPPAFYDEKGREIIDKIAVDEWFSGYKENVEYRKLGIGALMGDVVDRMVSAATEGGWRSEVASSSPAGRGVPVKFAMSGCHDTTLAAVLASLGAYNNEKWPPFTSSIAIELFSTADRPTVGGAEYLEEFANPASTTGSSKSGGLLSFFSKGSSSPAKQSPASSPIARVPLSDLDESTKKTLGQYYVRLRYNDRPVRIPGCVAKTANHLPGDDSFCTLDAFKEIVDKFTPQQWRQDCLENLSEGIFGKDGKDKSISGY
jgi:acid phosphatase